jgi:hypothetical protein
VKLYPITDARQKIRRRYGLTQDEYDAIVKKGCAICGAKAVLDHNHRTGKVRGPLCDRHNVALGGFDDSLLMLVRVAVYLIRHSWRFK